MFDYPTHGGAQIIGFDRVEFDPEGMRSLLICDRLTFVLSGPIRLLAANDGIEARARSAESA
jgi:hypothetical protein